MLLLFFCTENTYRPEVTVTGRLLVPDTDSIQLTPDLIQVTDHDTPAHRLTLRLLTLPVNGQLLLTRGGRETVLGHRDTFTVRDMIQGRVRFVHADGAYGEGVFRLMR